MSKTEGRSLPAINSVENNLNDKKCNAFYFCDGDNDSEIHFNSIGFQHLQDAFLLYGKVAQQVNPMEFSIALADFQMQ